MIPHCILYLDQKLSSEGYKKIYSSTTHKWEDVSGCISLPEAGGGEILISFLILEDLQWWPFHLFPRQAIQVLVILCFQLLSAFSWVNKLCWLTKPYIIGYTGWNSFIVSSKWQRCTVLKSGLFKSRPPAQAMQKASVLSFAWSRLPNCRLISANSLQGIWIRHLWVWMAGIGWDESHFPHFLRENNGKWMDLSPSVSSGTGCLKAPCVRAVWVYSKLVI